MGRIIRLTEQDLARIVRRVINEKEMIFEDEHPLKITKALFDNYGRGSFVKGSYVVLSDGKTYKFSDDSIVYSSECGTGHMSKRITKEYTAGPDGISLPQNCRVSVKSLSLTCDSTGCKKDVVN